MGRLQINLDYLGIFNVCPNIGARVFRCLPPAKKMAAVAHLPSSITPWPVTTASHFECKRIKLGQKSGVPVTWMAYKMADGSDNRSTK